MDMEVMNKTEAAENLKKTLLEVKGDEEQEIDRLRQFKHAMSFIIGSAELEGLLNYETARKSLTMVAEVILQESFEMAVRKLETRYGRMLEDLEKPLEFAVLGFGKLGGRELGYHSDLDLVFLHSGSPASLDSKRLQIQEYGVRLIQRTIFLLTTMTRAGIAYKMDTRLRPSGNAGVLITPWEVFLQYHQSSAPWEHQALLKSRVVAGKASKSWLDEIQTEIQTKVYAWNYPKDLASQIHHLRMRKEKELAGESDRRKNLKEGRGGLMDVEFIVQYLQLLHGRDEPSLQTPETLQALVHLGRFGCLETEQVQLLKEGYTLLRLIENGLRLIYDDSNNMLEFDRIDQELFLMLLNRHGYEVNNLYQTVDQATKNIRDTYQRVMTQGF